MRSLKDRISRSDTVSRNALRIEKYDTLVLDPTGSQRSGPVDTGIRLGITGRLFPIIIDGQKLYRPAITLIGQYRIARMRRSAFD